MGYVYRPMTGAFYNDALEADYRAAGTWPGFYVRVADEDYHALMAGQATGKVIAPDKRCYPVLVEPPAPTQEEQVRQAFTEKAALMKVAGEALTPLMDAQELGIATDEELAALERWRLYRVMLNRLDISTAPDIQWPELPA